LKIGIVGAGVAGSYLAARLSGEHKVAIYERQARESFDAVCAWGTSRHVMNKLVKPCGINFEDYVLHDGRVMTVDAGDEQVHIRLKGLCVYDKARLEEDLGENVDVKFSRYLRGPPEEEHDLLIDATGLTRPLLPRVQDDTLIPCMQYKVKFPKRPMDDFYIRPFSKLTGYFWYFPLENGYAHVGAGDLDKRHIAEMQSFVKRHSGTIVKTVGRPIRITPPSLCLPFRQGNAVGVGESIGTVYPMLGEGIIPSTQCADLLCEHLYDLDAYERAVLSRFSIYKRVYDFIMWKIAGNTRLREQLTNLIRVYLHMKLNQNRYGLEVHMGDFLRVLKS
jgi:flavin-dependent dehydrogenase